ncbi:hypothetical protein ACI1MP_12265 [Kitasatospora griseola]|uniref:hypothetical protein n=1 Tax=Kitasatospora griseola TaxID=2064 RepID=UPI003855EAE0
MLQDTACQYAQREHGEDVPATMVRAVDGIGDVPCCNDCAYLHHKTTIREHSFWKNAWPVLEAGACAVATAALLAVLDVHILYVVTGAVGVFGYARKKG